jgi:hypothetical protein
MMLSITWGAVVKLCVVAAFAAFIRVFVRCMHDTLCKACKKQTEECCK